MTYVIAALIVAVVFGVGTQVGKDYYRRKLGYVIQGAWLDLKSNRARDGRQADYLAGAKEALDSVRSFIERG